VVLLHFGTNVLCRGLRVEGLRFAGFARWRAGVDTIELLAPVLHECSAAHTQDHKPQITYALRTCDQIDRHQVVAPLPGDDHIRVPAGGRHTLIKRGLDKLGGWGLGGGELGVGGGLGRGSGLRVWWWFVRGRSGGCRVWIGSLD